MWHGKTAQIWKCINYATDVTFVTFHCRQMWHFIAVNSINFCLYPPPSGCLQISHPTRALKRLPALVSEPDSGDIRTYLFNCSIRSSTSFIRGGGDRAALTSRWPARRLGTGLMTSRPRPSKPGGLPYKPPTGCQRHSQQWPVKQPTTNQPWSRWDIEALRPTEVNSPSSKGGSRTARQPRYWNAKTKAC